jgi:predicted nucleic acid-binding protein
MSDFVIFDTSVLVDELRTGRHRNKIQSTEGLVRTSSVVLAELLRGVIAPAERRFIRSLARNHPILTPTERNWLESGGILARMCADLGFEPRKLRDLHFDVLIALTARAHGARLITSNQADFEIINRYCQFQLEIW